MSLSSLIYAVRRARWVREELPSQERRLTRNSEKVDQLTQNFDGKSIRTVEGHASNGQLTALQEAFIRHFAFQCGYCTAGFLNEAQVLLERLEHQPVAREALEQTILVALDGHLCRCTGYVRYHEAVRDVILAQPARYLL